MLREIGYCTGIENYSRYMDGRYPGEPPFTLLDYFPKDFLMFIDESHVTVPQIRAMYNGDRARKEALVEYGFRLPAALEGNRPLKFEEFQGRTHQVVYVSATPAPYELERSEQTVEQIIRPTGLLDPVIEVRPIRGQVDDLVGEIRKVTSQGYRAGDHVDQELAESLTDYLQNWRSRYVIFIPILIRWSARKLSVISGWACSMCWWASTCFGKVWIFRRRRLLYWMRTRRVFS